MPLLSEANGLCVEVHDLCFGARDGLSGGLDYGFLGKNMDLMELSAEEQFDIIRKIQRVEQWLKDHGGRRDQRGEKMK